MIAVLKQRSSKYLAKGIIKLRNKLKNDVELTEYYFGYGANLDTNRFAKNNMLATEVGVATLTDHKLKFTLATEYKDKSYAGVHEELGASVPGVLVKMDKVSLHLLDQLEWCGHGAYERVLKTVMCNGEIYRAWVYIVKYPDFNRVPSTLYLENMIKAAESRTFPSEYIDYLKGHESRDSFEIDHSFSLRTYSASRKYVEELKPLYVAHDKIRDKLCELI